MTEAQLAEATVETPKVASKKVKMVVSPLTGATMPAGRAKGVPNRVTITVKQAIEQAIQPGGCHPKGLAGWLIDRAKGPLGDRQIFASVVNKFVPVQLNATVGGGIKLELGWLAERQIGMTASQKALEAPQVVDLELHSSGEYRIIDQTLQSVPTPAAQAATPAPAVKAPAAAAKDTQAATASAASQRDTGA